MTIAKMVAEYLDESAPPCLTVALIELIARAREISNSHEVCTVCLITLASDIVNQAVDDNRLNHAEDDEGEDGDTKAATHAAPGQPQ